MTRRSIIVLLCFVASLVLGLASAAAGGGCHSSSTELSTGRSAGPTTITIVDCEFSPGVIYVDPGTEISWVNEDPVPHSVTGAFLSLHGDKLFNSGARTGAFRFDDAGVYPYYCVLHPGMAGAVVVGDVGPERAAAEPIQGVPLAITGGGGLPPAETADGGSSAAVPVAVGAGIAVVLLAAGAASWRRRSRQTGAAPVAEGPSATG